MMLVTHIWQSTLCVGVAALLALALRQAPARTRHLIWLLASLKFLVPFSLLVATGTWIGMWTTGLSAPQGSVAVRWLDRSLSLWNLDVTSGVAERATGLPRAIVISLAAGWLIGAVAMTVSRWRRWQSLVRLAQSATRLERGREAEALQRVRRTGARQTPIELLECRSNVEPGVLGFIRPKLLWPAALTPQLTDEELDAILAHEACHVDRRDNLSALLQMIVETLFWFYPVIWWVGARLLSERERACDEEVVHMGSDRKGYAEGILKVCGFCLRSPVVCVSGVGGSDLMQRIERIMRHAAANTVGMPARLLLGAVALVLVSAPLATGVLSAHRDAAIGIARDGQEVYRVGNGVKAPKLVSEIKPIYTRAAMDAGIQGNVLLEVVVLNDGTVGDVEVVKSLDKVYGLDDEAVRATRQWRFEAGTKDGKPVAVRVDIELTFTLK